MKVAFIFFSFIFVSSVTLASTIQQIFQGAGMQKVCSSVSLPLPNKPGYYSSHDPRMAMSNDHLLVAQSQIMEGRKVYFVFSIPKSDPDQIHQVAAFADKIEAIEFAEDTLFVLFSESLVALDVKSGQVIYKVPSHFLWEFVQST